MLAHIPTVLSALTVETYHSPSEKADNLVLHLIRQQLDVGQACGVINADRNLVVADEVRAALLAIASKLVVHPAAAGHGRGIDVDQVARMLPLVTLHEWFGIQVPKSTNTQSAKILGDDGDKSLQQPGDVAEVESLLADI